MGVPVASVAGPPPLAVGPSELNENTSALLLGSWQGPPTLRPTQPGQRRADHAWARHWDTVSCPFYPIPWEERGAVFAKGAPLPFSTEPKSH